MKSPFSSMKWLLVLVGLALAVAIGVGVGCGHDSSASNETPIDTDIMAFLSEARALHHQANLKEDAGDLPGAVAAMERLVAAKRPHPEKRTPEVEEVLADAYARLAELQLKLGHLPEATKAIDSGLGHAPDATYFRGHLVEVQGLVMEANANELADAGKPEEAAKAREKAIQLLQEVVTIQEQVIQRSLSNKDGAQ